MQGEQEEDGLITRASSNWLPANAVFADDAIATQQSQQGLDGLATPEDKSSSFKSKQNAANLEISSLQSRLENSEAERTRLEEHYKKLLDKKEQDHRKFEAESMMSQEAVKASYKWKETELHESQKIGQSYSEKLAQAQQAFDEELTLKRGEAAKLADDLAKQLEEERGLNRSRTDGVQRDFTKMDEDSKKRFEEVEKEHKDAREEDKQRLIQREKESAKMEGEAIILRQEKERLEGRIKELQQKLSEAEADRGAGQGVKERIEKLQQELESTRIQSSERLKNQAEDYERRLVDLGPRGKKGCCGLIRA